jgi:eukaryotic-like serine/threonine-protein kinase
MATALGLIEDRRDIQLQHTLTLELDQRIPPAPSSLPTIPSDRFIVEAEHARGGCGRILRAHDRQQGRMVALKEPLQRKRSLEGLFMREAQLTARLRHPAVVPVYGAGRWPGGGPFYAMKLVLGRSLKTLLAEAGTLRARLGLVPRVLDVADAIDYAHSEGIIHGDIKPSNVIIGSAGETMVIDWGLARDLAADDPPAPLARSPAGAASTPAGAPAGTPAYMAPEQMVGGELDERTDVYGLGAMLYHLLTGQAPFAVGRDARPIPIAEREPEAPAAAVAIVDRAMADDPEDRYQTAAAFAADLHGTLKGSQTPRDGPRRASPAAPHAICAAFTPIGAAMASLASAARSAGSSAGSGCAPCPGRGPPH